MLLSLLDCLVLQAAQLVALAEGLTPQGSSRNGTNSSSSSSSSQPASCASHQLEAVVHQHLPIFHTEHCVFCRWGGMYDTSELNLELASRIWRAARGVGPGV